MPFGGGSSSPQTSTTTTVQELSPDQQRLLNLVVPAAEDISANPPELFPGSTIAPLDPLQIQAQQDVLALAGQGGALPGIVGAAGDASNFLLGPVLFPESNPALQAATQAAIRPLEQQFSNVTLQGIRHDAITAGGFGGSRQGIAEGLAAQGLSQASGDVTAGIQANAFQQSLDAMTRALFAAPATAGLQFLPSTAIGAVGAQNQQIAQAQLSEEAQRFIAEQLIEFSVAQDVAALAFGFPGGSTTSTSTIDPGGGGSIINQILGGLGLAASVIGAPFTGGASLGGVGPSTSLLLA